MTPRSLPDLAREYPSQCGFMWTCGAHRYSVAIETMAYELAGARFDATCPACGFGVAYDYGAQAIRLDLRVPVAREIALDMTGNLDAPEWPAPTLAHASTHGLTDWTGGAKP